MRRKYLSTENSIYDGGDQYKDSFNSSIYKFEFVNFHDEL